MTDSIRKKLNELSELQRVQQELSQEKQALVDNLMEPIRQQLKDIEAEFAPMLGDVGWKISELEKEVRGDVLLLGESVKGDELHAIFAKGRTTWETAKLEGLCIAYPPLKELKHTGEPSVSIRAVKG